MCPRRGGRALTGHPEPAGDASSRRRGARVAAAIATVIAAVYLALSLRALPSYGLAWDEALGDLFFGHRNLAWLASGEARHLDFEVRDVVDGDGRTHPDLFLSPLRSRPWEHWPVMATLSALLCEGLARARPLLDPVDAHHLAGPLVTALLLPLLAWTAARAWGAAAGVVATLALLTHPRFLAATWFDLKDTGSAVFVTAAILLAWRALVASRAAWIWLLAAGGAAGLALGTKANALFLPIPLLFFALAARPSLPVRPAARSALAIAAAIALAILVVIAGWGWLRADPIARFALNLRYVGGRATEGGPFPHALPGLVALATWPLGSFGLVIAGAIEGGRALRRRSSDLAGLALLATLFPLARLSAPGMLSFDGIRHALELVPAAALLAGAGAAALLGRAAGRPRLAALALTLALLEPLVEVAFVHPHEVAHASPLVGGAAGARRLGLPTDDYWATGYRRAYAWLDASAEPGAAVGAGVAGHLLAMEGPLRLRADLRLFAVSTPFAPEPDPRAIARFREAARAGPAYLVYITRTEWYSTLVREAEGREPVYTDGPEGAPLVKIVRMD